MKYGLNVTGKVRVFSKTKTIQGQNKKKFDITDVWFNISEQNDDGSYFNIATNLIFKKGLPLPENNSVIIIEGFPMITGNGNYRKVAYYVNAWGVEQESGQPVEVSDDPFANDGKPIDIKDEDLPF